MTGRPLEYLFIQELWDVCYKIIIFNQSISWILFCLIIFFAIKRSKSLGGFRWYLLNHSVWCILFGNGLAFFGPVFLPPAFGGFCSGIFRQQGPRATLVQAGFCILCGHNALVGVTISLVHRYFIYPNKWQKLFHSKWMISIYFLEHFIVGSIIIFCHCFYGNIDYYETRKEALEIDETLSYFFNESSFLVINSDTIKVYISLGLLGVYGLVLFAAIIGYFFVKRLRSLNFKERSFASFKITRMIFISNVIKFVITVIYLVFPYTIFLMASIIDIPYSGPIVMLAFTFCSFHCIMEFSASFYFILPYRKYIRRTAIIWLKKKKIC